jgi:hypothetical protein
VQQSDLSETLSEPEQPSDALQSRDESEKSSEHKEAPQSKASEVLVPQQQLQPRKLLDPLQSSPSEESASSPPQGALQSFPEESGYSLQSSPLPLNEWDEEQIRDEDPPPDRDEKGVGVGKFFQDVKKPLDPLELIVVHRKPTTPTSTAMTAISNLSSSSVDGDGAETSDPNNHKEEIRIADIPVTSNHSDKKSANDKGNVKRKRKSDCISPANQTENMVDEANPDNTVVDRNALRRMSATPTSTAMTAISNLSISTVDGDIFNPNFPETTVFDEGNPNNIAVDVDTSNPIVPDTTVVDKGNPNNTVVNETTVLDQVNPNPNVPDTTTVVDESNPNNTTVDQTTVFEQDTVLDPVSQSRKRRDQMLCTAEGKSGAKKAKLESKYKEEGAYKEKSAPSLALAYQFKGFSMISKAKTNESETKEDSATTAVERKSETEEHTAIRGVRPIHLDLPPKTIDFQELTWDKRQWNWFTDLKTSTKNAFCSFECILVEAMGDLVFQLVIAGYGRSKKLFGKNLLQALSLPKDLQKFHAAMFRLLKCLESFNIPIKSPSCTVKKDESLIDYFSRVVEEEYETAMKPTKESTMPRTKEEKAMIPIKNHCNVSSILKKDTGFLERLRHYFWKAGDVPDILEFTVEYIDNYIQRKKCFVLVNWMVHRLILNCFSYEELEQWPHITEQIVAATNLSLFETQRRSEISFDINLLAFHLPKIEMKQFNGCITKEGVGEIRVAAFTKGNDTTSNYASFAMYMSLLMRNFIETLQELCKSSGIKSCMGKKVESIIREGRRPPCRNIEIPEETQGALNQFYFTHEGYLRCDIKSAVDFGDRNSTIQLEQEKETMSGKHRGDFRIFLPLISIPYSENAGEHFVSLPHSLYGRVEALLHMAGLIDIEHERLDDVGLIFGGSTYQHLHHDFVPSDDADTSSFAEALIGPFSPASILIGMNQHRGTRLLVESKMLDLTKSS